MIIPQSTLTHSPEQQTRFTSLNTEIDANYFGILILKLWFLRFPRIPSPTGKAPNQKQNHNAALNHVYMPKEIGLPLLSLPFLQRP